MFGPNSLRVMSTSAANRYFSSVIGVALILFTLAINLAESYLAQSLRNIFTLLLGYYLLSSLLVNRLTVTTKSLVYLLFLLIYAVTFYAFGSGNNLIVNLLTICFGVVLFYNALLALQFEVPVLWGVATKIWNVIYLTLGIELLFAVGGYQGALYSLFPEENRAYGLQAYRLLDNTFSTYFGLEFKGLNSITLQTQAFGQFCAMLTILAYKFTEGTFRKQNIWRIVFYLIVPVLMFTVSPNITSAVILIFIGSFHILFKTYLKRISLTAFLTAVALIVGCVLFYFYSDAGFIKAYQADQLYDLFVGGQLDYMLTRSLSDYLIGVNLYEYTQVSPTFEIAILSYLSVSGLIFGAVNLIIVCWYALATIRQARYLYQSGLVPRKNIDIQIMNLVFAISMLISSIHFPVITNYFGTVIFIFHMGLGLYILKRNRSTIRTVNKRPEKTYISEK